MTPDVRPNTIMKPATANASRIPFWVTLATPLMFLAGCSDSSESTGSALSGQVQAPSTSNTAKATHYAASRFLEQAAFGPSPESVARVKALGIQAWVDEQLKLPVSKIVTPDANINYDLQDRNASNRAWNFHTTAVQNQFLGSADQIRLRMTWALSNFVVVSTRKIQPYGGTEFFNTLQTHALGNYGDLLRAVTLSPAMGFFLDNGQNTRWGLNENYGRELLQLFSVGLVQLNPDGTVKRDAAGKPLETYNQSDVIAATRALTGWNYAPRPQMMNDANGFNYGIPMQASNADAHDTGEKTVLGAKIPAGQDASKDLDSLVAILMNHPNTAPFVSLRLIQGLTTSDPSPAYLGRVSAVFKNSKGDLAQTAKAILLDPEARAGDDPARSARSFGRLKEPQLLHTSIFRALSCRQAVRSDWDPTQVVLPGSQTPFHAESVFNFYPPNHRAPGSQLLAPEQKLLNANGFNGRSYYNGVLRSEQLLADAGCDVALIQRLYAKGDDAVIDWMSDAFYRGAMPAAVRAGLKDSVRNSDWLRQTPSQFLGALVDVMNLTPAFGAVK